MIEELIFLALIMVIVIEVVFALIDMLNKYIKNRR